MLAAKRLRKKEFGIQAVLILILFALRVSVDLIKGLNCIIVCPINM